MSITGALVLFATLFFLVLFLLLPWGHRSQEEAGEVVPGTPAGAPDQPMMTKKALIAAAISALPSGAPCAYPVRVTLACPVPDRMPAMRGRPFPLQHRLPALLLRLRRDRLAHRRPRCPRLRLGGRRGGAGGQQQRQEQKQETHAPP